MEQHIVSELASRGIERIGALIVLGSGMSGCFGPEEYDVVCETGGGVNGHPGRLALLRGMPEPVLLGLGRRHLYEGYAGEDVVAVVRAAARLGVHTVLLTNAAGGLNPRYSVGDVMLIEDCVRVMLGRNAVIPADAGKGAYGRPPYPAPRFATLLYDVIADEALRRGLRVARGTYATVPGPSYETRAEIRMLRRMGGDAVGMSTALEAAEAARLGMNVIGASLITNTLCDTERTVLDHLDVIEQGRRGERCMRTLLDAVLAVSAAGPEAEANIS